MRLLTAFLIGLIYAIGALASTVPTEVAKTVVFIYTDRSCMAKYAYGTGFLMGVSVPMHPDRSWVYLITAQHVLHTNGDDLTSPLISQLYIRVNTKSGDSAVIEVPIRTSGPFKTVFLNQDSDVDIAVLPIPPDRRNPDQYDIMLISEDDLATADDIEKMHLGVGTDMFFTGMFAPYQGERRNQPIVRFGKLALVPEEKVDFGGRKIDAYLVETFSFGGNSGSPVFFHPSVDNQPGVMNLGPLPIKIAGVMKGFFGDIEPIMAAQVTQVGQSGRMIPVSKSNTGVAVVVPAIHIKEILHSAELESQRQKELLTMPRSIK